MTLTALDQCADCGEHYSACVCEELPGATLPRYRLYYKCHGCEFSFTPTSHNPGEARCPECDSWQSVEHSEVEHD